MATDPYVWKTYNRPAPPVQENKPMSDDKIELNRRRVLGGMITLGGAAAAAGAGTYAWFSDTETSSNNTIQAGTLTLSGVSNGVFSATNIAPGQSAPSAGTNTITATYDSGSSVNPAEIDFSIGTFSEPSETQPTDYTTDETASALASVLNLDTAQLLQNGTVVYDFIADAGFTTLADLEGYTQDAAFSAAPGDTVSLELAVTMDTAAGNTYQADGVVMSVTFDAQQPGED